MDESERDNSSMRGSCSQENEDRNMSENRTSNDLTRNMDILTGEKNLRISQLIYSLLTGMNSQIESAKTLATSERTIP